MSFKIEDVTPEDITYIRRQLELEKVVITSPNQVSSTFYIIGHGIKATAVYEGASQVLTVNITDKPFWMPEAVLESKFESYVVALNKAKPDPPMQPIKPVEVKTIETPKDPSVQ